jgi:protein-S-isoprenylcysteine O-methyltransferase Ste14
MTQVAIFAVGLVLILGVSWRPLRDPHQYGFYRFFAMLAILFLLVLNGPVWFNDPLSPPQILSWLLLIGSALLAAHGFYLLRSVGRPEGPIENTTTVVHVGAYQYIRHPLYASLLLLAAGAAMKTPSLVGAILTFTVAVCLVATARVEEQENLTRFGSPYAEYMTTTKMFVPWLW